MAEFETVDDIIAGVTPDPAPDLQRMLVKNRDDALERLRAGRTAIEDRRAKQQKQDESAKWLAFAQGMLAPTRTGGFGESLGATAGLLRQEQELTRRHEGERIQEEQLLAEKETDVEQQHVSDRLRLAQIESNKAVQARARQAGSMKVYHPDDVEAVSRGEMDPSDKRIIWATQVLNPDGTTETQFASAKGEPLQVVSDLDPNLLAQLSRTKTASTDITELLVSDAQAGLAAMPQLTRMNEAREIMSGLERGTSGIQETVRKFTTYLGVAEDTIPDNADLAYLQSIFGRTILAELQKLTGPKSDFEYRQVERMNASLSGDEKGNVQIVESMLRSLNRVIDEGEQASGELLNIPGQSRYLHDRYSRFREQQPEQAPAARLEREQQLPEPTNPEAIPALLKAIEDMGPEGTKEQHDVILNQFREIFTIPEDAKVELRRLGVAI